MYNLVVATPLGESKMLMKKSSDQFTNASKKLYTKIKDEINKLPPIDTIISQEQKNATQNLLKKLLETKIDGNVLCISAIGLANLSDYLNKLAPKKLIYTPISTVNNSISNAALLYLLAQTQKKDSTLTVLTPETTIFLEKASTTTKGILGSMIFGLASTIIEKRNYNIITLLACTIGRSITLLYINR